MSEPYRRTISLPGDTIIIVQIEQGNIFELDEPSRAVLFGILDRIREYSEQCNRGEVRHQREVGQ